MDRAHRVARKQEKDTAAIHGGRVTPASGSGSIKNDHRNDDWSIEVKTTTGKTYSLALSTWITAETHALTDGRRAAMILAFDRGLGKPARRLVVISEEDFLELIDNGPAS